MKIFALHLVTYFVAPRVHNVLGRLVVSQNGNRWLKQNFDDFLRASSLWTLCQHLIRFI